MANYNLGTARGRVEIDSRGATQGFRDASRGADTFRDKFAAAGPALRRTGKAMMLAGTAVLGAVGLAVKASADFEKEISKFQSAAQETPAVLEEVRQKALQIGRDTSFGAGQAAQAITNLSYAGISTADILNGAADAAVALAEAGELDVAQASSIAAAAMNIWQLEATELMDVSDTLIGVMANSDTMVDQLGEAFVNAGATAATLGVSVEDTAVSLGLLADRGIKGGKAGTTLNRMLLQLTNQTPKAAAAMEELGLMTEDGANAFFDAEGNLKSMSEVSQLLQDSLQGLTKEQKAAYLETIFGTRALAAATALAEAGAEGFDELSESMGEISAADVASEKLDNLAGALTILKGTLETALISAGSPVQESLKGIVRGITDVVNAFASMDPRWQKMITLGAIAAGALLLVGGAFMMLLGMLAGAVAGFGTLTGVILPVVAPIVAVIAAIALLAAGLVYLWRTSDQFREGVQRIARFLRGTLLAAFESVSSFLQGAFTAAMEWLKNAWEEIQPSLEDVGALLRTMFDRFRELGEVIEPFARAVGTFLAAAFGRLMEVAGPVLRFLAEVLGGTIMLAIEGVIQAFKGMVQIITGLLDVFIGLFTGDWSRMWEGVKSIATGIFNFIVGAVKTWLAVSVAKVFRMGLNAIRALWRNVWNGIRSFFQGIIQGITRNVQGGITGIRTIFQTGLNFIRNLVQTIFNGIVNFIRSYLTTVRSVVNASLNGIRTIFSTVLNFIRNLVTSVFSAIRNTMSTASNTARNLVTSAFNGMRSAVSGALNGLLTLVRGLPGRIRSGLGNLRNLLLNAGRDLIRGLIQGIKNMAGAAARAARDAVSGAVGAVTGLLRSSSPSKLFIDIGEDTLEGFVLGIRAMASDLRGAMTDVTKSAVGAGEMAAEGASDIPYAAGRGAQNGVTPQRAREILETFTQSVTIEKIEALDPREAARIADDELGWQARLAAPGLRRRG